MGARLTPHTGVLIQQQHPTATAAQGNPPSPCQCSAETLHTYPHLNPAPAACPAWDTQEVTWGTAAMEELGSLWPRTPSQKLEHRDLPQPCCKGWRSQKPPHKHSTAPFVSQTKTLNVREILHLEMAPL